MVLAVPAKVRPALLLVLLGACSARLGAGGGSADDDDDGARPDAAIVRPPDAAVPDAPAVAPDNACGVAAMQGNLGSLTGVAAVNTQGTSTQKIYFVGAPTPPTATSATPDILAVELWDNYGAFAGGVARTGTFSITGDETDYDTCGVCVLMLANVANNTPAKLLLATSGSVTVTSIAAAAGQTTQVTVSNASFVEITLVQDQGYQQVAGSSCPSPVGSATLSGTL